MHTLVLHFLRFMDINFDIHAGEPPFDAHSDETPLLVLSSSFSISVCVRLIRFIYLKCI